MSSNIKDVQKVVLQLLDKFIEVCDKYGLQWFADSGTLLGAIRKGKIIDWDDDVDVIMPRKDYNRFLQIAPFEFKAPYFFQSPFTDTCWNPICKLRYDNSAIFEKNKYTNNDRDFEYHKGIFIDIFVFDAVPEEDIFTSEEYFLRFIYNFSLAKNYGRKSFNHTIDYKAIFDFITKTFEDLEEKNKDSEYVANLFFNYQRKYMHFKFHRSAYSDYKEIDFEGLQHKLRIPIGWEEILVLWYGDDWRIEKHINDSHGLGAAYHDAFHSYKEYDNLSDEEYANLFNFDKN